MLKKALIIAINYVGTDAELRGCASDGERLYAYIKRCCPNCEIRVLSDDRRIKAPIFAGPTYNEILRQIDWLVAGATSASHLWISYSGHGGSQKVGTRAFEELSRQVKPLEFLSASESTIKANRQIAVPLSDVLQKHQRKSQKLDTSRRLLSFFKKKAPVKEQKPGELDNCDETILPMDFKRSGQILDDVLRKRLVDALPQGAKLTAFFDSCHSGTVLDLRYTWQDQDARSIVPNIEKQEHTALAESKASVLLLSGCRDQQTSADAFINNMYCGATTQALLTNLEKLEIQCNSASKTPGFGDKKIDDNNLDTLDEFLHAINAYMSANSFAQRPLVSLGRNENVKEAVETFFPIKKL